MCPTAPSFATDRAQAGPAQDSRGEGDLETVGSFWMWAGFAAVVAAMLAIDLFVVGGGKRHRVTMREAAISSMARVIFFVARTLRMRPRRIRSCPPAI